MMVDGTLGKAPKAIDDIRHGGVLIALRIEELFGHIENAANGLLGILVARHRRLLLRDEAPACHAPFKAHRVSFATRPHRTSRDLLTRCSHITYHWYVSVNCHMRTPRSLSAIHPRKILIIGRRKHPAKRDFNFWALARTAGKYRRTRGRERRSSGGRRPPCRGMATRTPPPQSAQKLQSRSARR